MEIARDKNSTGGKKNFSLLKATQVREGALEGLVYLCNHVDKTYLSQRMPEPYTAADGEAWLKKINENDGKNIIYRLITLEQKIIGAISVERKPAVYRIDGELGYILLDEYKNQGIMTEAVKEIVALALKELHLLRVTAYIYEPNTASRRVVEKNGFVLDGFLPHGVQKGDNVYDLCIYGFYK